MPSRKFIRKYQQGGVVPSFQGNQVLGQPQRIESRVNPIIFDPSSTFQALGVRQNNLRTAIDQAGLNRQERQDAWTIEYKNREYLDQRLQQTQAVIKSGQDQLTKLDLNIPDQYEMAQNMRRNLERINGESVAILTDNSLTPNERNQRLQEKLAEAQNMFSNPEYVKRVQNNAISTQLYDGMAKSVTSGKDLIDFNAANNNLELARKFQKGEIDRATFFNGLKNYTLDPKAVDGKEKLIDQYIRDSIDPDKAATNWEKYKEDDNFLIFQEKFKVPDLESQVDAVFELYKNDPSWLKVQEARGNRAFLDDQGLVDDEKLKAHIRRKIQLIRGSLNPNGQDMIVSQSINRKAGASGSTGGTAGRASTAGERRNEVIEQSLINQGYEVLDPSILDQLGSASEAINLLETPDSEITDKGDKAFKPELQRAIRKRQGAQNISPVQSTSGSTPGVSTRTPQQMSTGPAPITPRERLENVQFDDNGYIINEGLVIGDNNGIVPKIMDSDLAAYTNNPLNIKGRDDQVPVIKRFDREGPDDVLFHRVFPTMQAGTAAAVNLITKYQKGDIGAFNTYLKNNNKTLSTATIADFYRTWATGADDQKIATIARVIGVSPNTKLQDVDASQLFMGVLSVESPRLFQSFTGRNSPQTVGNQQQSSPISTGIIEQRIQALSDYKNQLNANNQFNDNLTEQNKAIDKQIQLENANLGRVKSILPKVDALDLGAKTEVEIGPPVTYPPIGMGGRPTTVKNYITIERSNDGLAYRVTASGKVIADALTRDELDRYIQMASGRTRAELNQLTSADIQAVPNEQPAKPATNNKAAVSNTNTQTGLGFFDN